MLRGRVNSSDDYSDGIRFATEHEVDRKWSFGLRAKAWLRDWLSAAGAASLADCEWAGPLPPGALGPAADCGPALP